MKDHLKEYESKIKKKLKFGFTPKYIEDFSTGISETVFHKITTNTVEKLDWEVAYVNTNTVDAKVKNKWNKCTENVFISFDRGIITVKSESNGSELVDLGRNSKRVKLFIYAFKETVINFDDESLEKLEEEIISEQNLDDYEIPESLPAPKPPKKIMFWPSVLIGVLASLAVSFVFAFLTTQVIYLIILYELGVALFLGFVLKQGIILGNYTNYDKLHKLLIGLISLIFIGRFVFEYQILQFNLSLNDMSFWDYIILKFELGLQLEGLDLGWIGMVGSWLLHLFLIYIYSTLKTSSKLIVYMATRVPSEVVDFAFYHYVKEKEKHEVREELARMGWTNPQNQDEVIEAIGSHIQAKEMNRIN